MLFRCTRRVHNSGDDNTNATIQQEASLGLSVCQATRRITKDKRLDTDASCTSYDTENEPSGQNGPEGPPQTAGERLCQRR